MQAVWDEQDAHVAQWATGAQDAVQCMRRESAACTAASPHRQRLQQPSQGQDRPAHRPWHSGVHGLPQPLTGPLAIQGTEGPPFGSLPSPSPSLLGL